MNLLPIIICSLLSAPNVKTSLYASGNASRAIAPCSGWHKVGGVDYIATGSWQFDNVNIGAAVLGVNFPSISVYVDSSFGSTAYNYATYMATTHFEPPSGGVIITVEPVMPDESITPVPSELFTISDVAGYSVSSIDDVYSVGWGFVGDVLAHSGNGGTYQSTDNPVVSIYSSAPFYTNTCFLSASASILDLQ
jgi:hypothetical protein